MYFALGASLALAGFFILNACFSLATTFLFHAAEKVSPARPRAAMFFLLRILPACVSALCILLLVLPSYFLLEPHGTSERIGWALSLLAAFSAALLAYSLVQGVISWRRSRIILRDWLQRSQTLSLPGISIPAYTLRESFPVVAVIGALRPRLFISEHVFEALNAEEFAATLQHEIGHITARDNLKRWLAQMCPAAFPLLSRNRKFNRLWHAASEECADSYAVQKGKASPLNLASALIKVSRMMPCQHPPVPAGAYFLGQEDLPDVARRVHALLAAADGSETIAATQSTAHRKQLLLPGFLVASTVLLALSYPALLSGVHELLEQFLHLVS
jgi:Peptidase family M48